MVTLYMESTYLPKREREGHRRLFVSDVLNVAEFYVSPHSQMTMSYFLVPRQRELRRRLVLRRHHPIQRKSTISLSAQGRPFGITLRNCQRSQNSLSASTVTRRYVHAIYMVTHQVWTRVDSTITSLAFDQLNRPNVLQSIL